MPRPRRRDVRRVFSPHVEFHSDFLFSRGRLTEAGDGMTLAKTTEEP